MSAQAFNESWHPRDDAGRFAEREFERAGVELPPYHGGVTGDFTAFELADDPYSMSDEEYNRSGSYDYPPVPRSAAQIRRFWAQTQIPDVAIRQYEKVYAADVEAGVQAHMQAWDRTHPEPDRSLVRNRDAHAAWAEERADAEREFRGERQPSIHRPFVRTAVRVMKMIEDAKYLGSEGMEKVLDMNVSYSPHFKALTIRKLDEELGIRSRTFRDRALATTAELEASTQDAPLRDEMNNAIAQLSSQIQQVQATAQGTQNAVVAGAEWEDRRAGRLR